MTDAREKKHAIDRRHFVAAGATVTALAGASMLGGCAPKTTRDSDIDSMAKEIGPYEGGRTVDVLNDGEWKFAYCNKGCGGGCLNRVLVKDGKVVRTLTDNTHEDSIGRPQFRNCVRGRHAVERDFGADRIKYPMKRRNWSPDNPNGELRGQDEWVRITWDEALDTIADVTRKVYTTYGPRSVYVPYPMKGNRPPFIEACGGCLTPWDSTSFGSYLSGTKLLGLPEVGYGSSKEPGSVNDRLDLIENADLIVLYGQDPAWSAVAFATWNFRAAKENGAEFIYVGPFNNATANMLDAKWIRILPGTDTAFMLAVVYEMLRLDEEEGGIIDWDFLHTYCVGFDDESMPADAQTPENIAGYVRGEYDGVPKTPEWASAICGTPAEDVTYFARAIGKSANVAMSHGLAAARCVGAEEIPQLYMTLACMGGHIGKPGNCLGLYWVDNSGDGGEKLVKAGASGDSWDVSGCTPLCDPADMCRPTLEAGPHRGGKVCDDHINALQAFTAVTEGTYDNVGTPWGLNWRPKETKTCDIHFIYGEYTAGLRSLPNTMEGIEAFRKVDCVVMAGNVPKPDMCYADIILPLVTHSEQESIMNQREQILYYEKIFDTEPEAKTARWVNEQLLERLGYDPSTVYAISPEQALYNQFAGTTVMDESGEYVPLLTITAEDIAAMGAEGEPQEGKITLAEFKERGIYSIERKPGDAYSHIGFSDFIADPEGHPLASASGKFEIYCQAKADVYNMISFDGRSYKPYPTYQEVTPVEGYPLRCFNPHYPRAAGTMYPNILNLREAWSAPVMINVNDAAAQGIESGDTVLVSSPSGRVLRHACVTNLMIEGAIGIPNSLWANVDEEGIDRGGGGSTLIGGAPSGMGITGHNNAWVKIEKWTGEELVPDCEWQQIIEASE